MEISENLKKRMTDEQTKQLIFASSGCRTAADFQRMPIARRDDAIKNTGDGPLCSVSIRQASRMTGVSVGIVRKFSN